MTDAKFMFYLETLEKIATAPSFITKEDVDAETVIDDETMKSFLDKVADSAKAAFEAIKDWFSTASKSFGTLIDDFNKIPEDQAYAKYVLLAGVGISLGSVVLMIAALINKVRGEAEGLPYVIVDAEPVTAAKETTTKESDSIFDGLTVKPVKPATEATEFGIYELRTFYSLVLFCIVGLVAILAAKQLAQSETLQNIIAAWSVAQIAIAGYTSFSILSAAGYQQTKMDIAMGILVAGLAVITGVTVTVPAIKKLISSLKGKFSVSISVAHANAVKDEFDKIKDKPEAAEIRDKVGKVYDKAVAATQS